MPGKKQIVPLVLMPHPLEQQLIHDLRNTRIIYIIILAFLFTGFALLFVIKTDVTVKATGNIKSLAEKNDIKVPASGIVDSLFIQENAYVTAGQPLLKVRTEALEQKGAAMSGQLQDLEDRIHDLKLLTKGKASGLRSSLYTQQYHYYRQKLADANSRQSLAVKNFNRYAYLYQNNAVSQLEYDKAAFEKGAAAREAGLVRQQQMSQWQTDLNTLTNQLKNLSADLGVNQEYQSQYLVKADVSGTVQDLKGIQRGSFVTAGESLGMVSPDSGLIAETYVLPKDIGLIRKGNPVRMQIDAFNYNSWGTVEGTVEAISGDVSVDGQQPYFKVRCRLKKTSLQLKNGYKGQLKKGMTMQARFKIARRTIFQLLYDQTSDWLNP
jgi:membrane fusion protein, peptide pheromone/bacteriocin exporter